MSEKMRKNLKIGFLLEYWSIDCFWSSLIFVGVWLAIAFWLKENGEIMGIAALILVIFGMVMFETGRVIVGLQSRKLNFSDKELTMEEEWFLQEMLGVEDDARMAQLESAFGRMTSEKADDILLTYKNKGVIGHYFAIGKVYTGKNIVLNHWILLAVLVVTAIVLFINL